MSPNKGDLILVRWNSKRTCPAMVIEGHLIYKQPAKNGNVWVYWFGEHKVSEVGFHILSENKLQESNKMFLCTLSTHMYDISPKLALTYFN